ncbi:MAG: BolA family transcriptional regulator [Devosiaceae bacterium]|nr:BolA family transcriptional regulator [Devosiaceae bacterium]
MGIYEKIEEKLTAKFQPAFLQVLDESENHRGHANWIEGKSTHFRVKIYAASLEGLSRIAQQRSIMDALDEEFKEGLHALVIKVLKTPPS